MKQVSAIRQIGGGTNTHKPLEYIRQYMFTRHRGDREGKPNVCIVITDGQSYDAARTAKAAKAVSIALAPPVLSMQSLLSVIADYAESTFFFYSISNDTPKYM